jgi:hypothetical protein
MRFRLLAIAAICGLTGCSRDVDPGPQPRGVVDNPQAEFGKVAVGKSVSHTYTIRNEGDAELVLDEPKRADASADYEVQCTLSSRRVTPGESATAHLRIRPLQVTPKLYAGVHVGTNGPEEWIRFGGRLTVEPPLVLKRDAGPDTGPWTLKIADDGEPAAESAKLYSVDRDRFGVLEVNSSNPGIRLRTNALTADDLKELQAKSGYAVTIEAIGLNDVGRFEGELTIKTDISPGGTKQLTVQGVRWGPVRVVNPGTIKWNHEAARADLGLFPAKTGKSAILYLVMKAPADGPPPSIRQPMSNAPILDVSVERDQKRSTASTSWFKLTLTVPPGRPPERRSYDNPVEVTLTSDHPRATTIRLLVQFVSH